jgi:hypothetical protein
MIRHTGKLVHNYFRGADALQYRPVTHREGWQAQCLSMALVGFCLPGTNYAYIKQTNNNKKTKCLSKNYWVWRGREAIFLHPGKKQCPFLGILELFPLLRDGVGVKDDSMGETEV